MTASPPFFSVVMATWGRGRHILPSVQSVLQQTLAEFELLVVGDGCNDETESVVTGLADPRLHWMNLPERVGSQSGPNNAGIAAARGEVIAYLGHDDIWEPDHLQRLVALYQSDTPPDFGITGAILHRPNGLAGSTVMGIFDDDADVSLYPFPASSISHRKAAIHQIGVWRMPAEIRAPVDADFYTRGITAGLRFRSTKAVTLHKFSAAQRYLGYVRQKSSEQQAMLAQMASRDHAALVQSILDSARQRGTYMAVRSNSFDDHAPGELARISEGQRGISLREVPALGRGALLRHRQENCALDWQPRPVLGVRRHFLNPQPSLLLPFTAAGSVELTFPVVHPNRDALGPLQILCNDEPVTAHPTGLRPSIWGWHALYRATIRLQEDAPTVLEFVLTPKQRRKRKLGPMRLGFGLGMVNLRPLT